MLDRVITGELDGAHMLAGQPLGATIGFGTKADIVTAVLAWTSTATPSRSPTKSGTMMKPARPDGRATASRCIRSAPTRSSRRSTSSRPTGKPFKMAHGLPGLDAQLRAALLARRRRHPSRASTRRPTSPGQIAADVLISVTPPPQMPATLEAGTINGYCVGEPWNQQAIFKGIGVPVITDYEIWKNNPEKVFGVTKALAEKNPQHAHRADQGADPRRPSGSTQTTARTARKRRRSCRGPNTSAPTAAVIANR